jgi:hypothetical protein
MVLCEFGGNAFYFNVSSAFNNFIQIIGGNKISESFLFQAAHQRFIPAPYFAPEVF